MRSASMTTGIFTSLRALGPAFKEFADSITGQQAIGASGRPLLDSDAAPGFLIERRIRAFQRRCHQRLHRGTIEISGAVEANVTPRRAGSLQQALGIRQRVTLE